MKRVLVTGGLGFIGSNLVKRLVKEGYKVEVVDDLSSGSIDSIGELKVRNVPVGLLDTYLQNGNEEVDVLSIHGDFADDAILNRVSLKTYDSIFHLAAVPRVEYSVEFPSLTTDINVMRTIKLMTASVGNIEKFIFSSSSAIYGCAQDNYPAREDGSFKPSSPYGLQKLVVEQYCSIFHELYGFQSVCLRYFNVYGPGQLGDSPYSTAVSAWMDRLKKGLPLRSDGDGKQTRDMIYVDDIVEANILCEKTKRKLSGEVLNIGTGFSISNNQILEKLSNKFSFEVISAPERKGDVKHTKADTSKASDFLNFNSSTSFEIGLEKTISWWGLDAN